MRQIPVEPQKVMADVEGDIAAINRVLRITEIRVRYRLRIPRGMRPAAERAVATHEEKCPAAMSVKGCIRLVLSAEFEEYDA